MSTHASVDPDTALDDLSDHYDVAILGGGITGLTLALQLTRSVPDVRVLVAEKRAHPVPEAAHKVGESSVEIQGHYLRDILGLTDHLEDAHLRKFGLRMFFTQGGNTDIARRVEFGQVSPTTLPSYQLDRGRLENALGERISGDTDFVSGCGVAHVQIGEADADHVVRLQRGGEERTVTARWIVDATGRSSLLKRQLGLARGSEHRSNSAWFRIDHPIDVNEWSDDEQWHGRVTDGERRLSTNHLMGPGYWVWLIPLASGTTSVGIVAEDSAHSFDGFNTLDRALAWLHEHEPQCAADVERHRDEVLDFRVMKDYAYGCEQVYSADRWCLTGEAGVSIDPLYSSGGDLMAISNGLITDLVRRDRGGEELTEPTQAHNQLYLLLSQMWLVAYENQYPIMGNAQVMTAKVIWDTVTYWSFPGLLYFQDKLRRLGDSSTALANLLRCWTVHERMQRFLHEWHDIDNPESADTFADPYTPYDYIIDLHEEMALERTDEELEEQLTRNARLLGYMAGQMVSTVMDRLSAWDDDPAVAAQLAAWDDDDLIADVLAVYRAGQTERDIDNGWVTLGYRGPAQVREEAR